MSAYTPRRKGFSLIEAAIVLGIVGLVIGGIWVAASAVYYKMAFNDIWQAILQGRQVALKFQRQTPADEFINIGTLMNGKPLASGLPYSSAVYPGYYTSGKRWVSLILDTSNDNNNAPFYNVSIHFNTPDPFSVSSRPDVKLCMLISAEVMKQKLGRRPDMLTTSHSIYWNGTDFWDWGDPPLTLDDIAGYCATAEYVEIMWRL